LTPAGEAVQFATIRAAAFAVDDSAASRGVLVSPLAGDARWPFVDTDQPPGWFSVRRLAGLATDEAAGYDLTTLPVSTGFRLTNLDPESPQTITVAVVGEGTTL
jgi:hypothetical protein